MNITTSIKPESILANCTLFKPLDKEYINHSVIQRFGSPLQPIYVDQCNVDIGGVQYESPLILPIVNGQLESVQCAVLQDARSVAIYPNGLAQGFAYFNELQIDKPVIITYNLEAFFKIS